MSDTYARVMRPADEPGKRRATRSGTGRRSGPAPSLAAAPSQAKRTPAGTNPRAPAGSEEQPAGSAGTPAEATFAAAAGAFTAGRDAQADRDFFFEDVSAPKRLAPYATAIAATVQRDGADVAWGRLVLLYDPDGQEGWDGAFRLVAYIRADAVPGGTVTRVITEGFGAKRDELPLTGFELRASWSPTGPGNSGADGSDLDTLDLSAHISAWCDCLSAAAGLEPPGTLALRRPGRG